MARPIVPDRKKKRQCSFTLDPVLVVMLDNLCSLRDLNRSKMISELIATAGWTDLGLAAIEEHIMDVRAPHFGGACNPRGKMGLCLHPLCQAIYKREGIR